ncbi:MAG: hypothetical protein ACP5R5_05320, partial [Armatimonadota bacterium]
MRKVTWLLYPICAAVLAVAGCGGGGGGDGSPTPTVQVTLTVPPGAAPAGVTPTVVSRTTTDAGYEKLAGSAFVAAALCQPGGTTFSQPVTLTFTLVNPLGAGDTVNLFWCDPANNWTTVAGAQVTVSTDRRTVTVGN